MTLFTNNNNIKKTTTYIIIICCIIYMDIKNILVTLIVNDLFQSVVDVDIMMNPTKIKI